VQPIVVGVDGSAGSYRALAWAVEEARLRRCPLVALHAWEPPVVAAAPVGGVVPPPDDALLESGAEALLSEALTTVDLEGVVLERKVVPGSAWQALCDRSGSSDLLVVGASGHGAVVGALLGSVSQHCVRHSHCPVVIVPRSA
jgi:nucleotide-binding universal stress UspA family protein